MKNYNIKNYKKKISIYLNYIFILYAGTFVINPSLGREFFYILTVLWLIEGHIKTKFILIYKQKVLIFYTLMIIFFLLSLSLSNNFDNGYWSSKYTNGFKYLEKEKYFFIAFYLSTSLKQDYYKYVALSFFSQVLFVSIYSICIHLQIFTGDKYSSITDPVVFLDHTHFSILLATGLIFSIYIFLKEEKILLKVLTLIVFSIIFTSLMLIAGRLGQLSFFVSLIFISGYYFYKKNRQKYFFISLAVLCFSILLIFNLSTTFRNRSLEGINNIQEVIKKKDYNSSWGVRIGLDILSYDYLTSDTKRFIFGAGMGDAKINIYNFAKKFEQNKLFLLKWEHVHNQFFQTWINGSIFGLISFLLLLYTFYRIKVSFKEKILIIGLLCIFIIDSIGNLIFHRLISIELFGFVIGYCLSLENFKKSN